MVVTMLSYIGYFSEFSAVALLLCRIVIAHFLIFVEFFFLFRRVTDIELLLQRYLV